jgi:NAD(P)-dependent dehydrogenase (short-subunit alcohol dehydrogenase family)
MDVRACIETLEAIVADRAKLAELDDETRRRLVVAAGRVSRPERAELRRLAKARRRSKHAERTAEDERRLSSAQIRVLRSAPVFKLPPGTPDPRQPPTSGGHGEGDLAAERRDLNDPRKCYICKNTFSEVHHFYDQMCPPCAALNWEKRNASADLRGRVALVTGARVKIGYHAALKLLRAGAHVIVTTRFASDALSRYSGEDDYASFRDRLDIHGIDLRHTPSVEALCKHLNDTLPRLDFILNNACQTVRRPPGYYRHLMDGEKGALPAGLTQLALVPEDHDVSLFPIGKLDADLQQVDLRGRNSWRLLLHEVPTVELLEVHLVNAVAPFVINGRLRALMNRTDDRDKHIVNVSAMEGQFYRSWKTDRHPHTNMAKAALNMMTRTSAADYVKDGIHMNAVDTGWVTDEDPAEIAARKIEVHGFHPPLDIVDGAARIVDPIFHGQRTGEHAWGLFFKDYKPTPW